MTKILQVSQMNLDMLWNIFGLCEFPDGLFVSQMLECLILQDAIDDGKIWITKEDETKLEEIRRSYWHQKSCIKDRFSETLVHSSMIDPLLRLCGFYAAPFYVEPEVPMSIMCHKNDNQSQEVSLVGAIDKLVLHKSYRLKQDPWILLIETKRPPRYRQTFFSKANFKSATAQILSYMMADQNSILPLNGLLTDGNIFYWVKIFRSFSHDHVLTYNEHILTYDLNPEYIYYGIHCLGFSRMSGGLNYLFCFLKYVKEMALKSYGSN
jgi:hypothetical protein